MSKNKDQMYEIMDRFIDPELKRFPGSLEYSNAIHKAKKYTKMYIETQMKDLQEEITQWDPSEMLQWKESYERWERMLKSAE